MMASASVSGRMVLSRVYGGIIPRYSVLRNKRVLWSKIDTTRLYATAPAAPIRKKAATTTTTTTTTTKRSAAAVAKPKKKKAVKKAAPKKKKKAVKKAAPKKKKKKAVKKPAAKKVKRIKLPMTRMNSWIVYLQEHPFNRAQYPTIVEYTKAMSNQYKRLNAQQIQVLKDSSVRQNERNLRERDSILRTLSPELMRQENVARFRLRKRGKKLRNLVNPDQPRRPANAYLLFVTARGNQSGVRGNEIIREAAQAWRMASVNEKRPFEEQAMRLRDQYKRDMAVFEAKQSA